ncbi:MAG: hypothetical protein OEY10_04090 [Nitrosopumilus sp.]|nr:hypothetical protein [Candidatus Nomurabacteria bacterium]MDH5665458.1 hypothetical protein [Nitrosopumilus sp.]
MKKYTISLFILAIVVGVGFGGITYSAHAQENTTEEDTSSRGGIGPANPFFFLDRFVEGLQQIFTFNPTAKAKLQARLGEERIAEIEAILAEEEIDFPALVRGQKLFAQSRLKAEKHLDKDGDDEDASDDEDQDEDFKNAQQEIRAEFQEREQELREAFKERLGSFKDERTELRQAMRQARIDGDEDLEDDLEDDLDDLDDDEENLEEQGGVLGAQISDLAHRFQIEKKILDAQREQLRTEQIQARRELRGESVDQEMFAQGDLALEQAIQAFQNDELEDAEDFAKDARQFFQKARSDGDDDSGDDDDDDDEGDDDDDDGRSQGRRNRDN